MNNVSPKTRDLVKEMHQDGYHLQMIKERTGLAESTLRYIIRECRVQPAQTHSAAVTIPEKKDASMITKRQRDNCTTHHNACDCKQWRYERLSSWLEEIVILIETMPDNDAMSHVLDQIYDIAKGVDA